MVKKPDPAVARLIAVYQEEYFKRHGIKPIIAGGKFGKLLKLILSTYADHGGEVFVTGLLKEFIWGNDSWARTCGWTVESFYNVAQRLALKPRQTDARTADNVAAAVRATQKQIHSR